MTDEDEDEWKDVDSVEEEAGQEEEGDGEGNDTAMTSKSRRSSSQSESALDLPYSSPTSNILKKPNLAKEDGRGLLPDVSSYAGGDIGGMASAATATFKKTSDANDLYERNMQPETFASRIAEPNPATIADSFLAKWMTVSPPAASEHF